MSSRGIAAARAAAALTVLGLLVACGDAARAGPSVMIDDTTGRVLYAEEPDQTWFPASLTKLMTAYLTFEAVKSGKLTWETKVPLSEYARGQPATRIGLRLGIELNVDQAVRGLILRSANDFAVALAELIGGSEPAFVERMNATAKRLGMSRTHFKNPHGLPDPEQISTARDLAKLARAILKDFPQQADVFSTPSVKIHKGTFHNGNDLLRTVPGADGMKTGFTCGAGYNIVASATREGKRIIVVVLGSVTRVSRSERATALIEHGFETVGWKEVLGAPQLAQLAASPAALTAVHDMSRETRTRMCGNLRGPRRIRARSAKKKPDSGVQASAKQ
ncbi:MAG: D-alanyl-D-alanine carboxypeptidase family protein [Hyphomicrobiaceae bacterium]